MIMDLTPPPVPRPLTSGEKSALGALTVVASGAAWASVIFLSDYGHANDLAGPAALLLPLTVDGLAAAAWYRATVRGGWLAWAGGWVATIVSVLGNAAGHAEQHGRWTLGGTLVGAWPPIALAWCVHLIHQMFADRRAETAPPAQGVTLTLAPPVADLVAPVETPDCDPTPPAVVTPTVEMPLPALASAPPTTAPAPAPATVGDLADRDARVARVIEVAKAEGVTSIRKIREAAQCSWDDAKLANKALAQDEMVSA